MKQPLRSTLSFLLCSALICSNAAATQTIASSPQMPRLSLSTVQNELPTEESQLNHAEEVPTDSLPTGEEESTDLPEENPEDSLPEEPDQVPPDDETSEAPPSNGEAEDENTATDDNVAPPPPMT